jgi:hypothetical protein
MAITQTIDIPANRRLIIDVPREIPVGPAVLTFTPADEADETEYLNASPANRERLKKAIEEIERGDLVTFNSIEEAIKHTEEQATA